jgi:transcriptional regulator with XRE-family HTH domain
MKFSAEKLKYWMGKKRMRQVELARALKIRPTEIWKYLNGTIKSPDITRVAAMAEALGVEAMALMESNETVAEQPPTDDKRLIRELLALSPERRDRIIYAVQQIVALGLSASEAFGHEVSKPEEKS